ncbi:hypothetical protein [Sediminibacter sp. Hel_I_10]|uniref:hypothetical protein n=1 Tax=Sediminibacter sp. Hel_I_10 TaxID=1392490 RepID=UPI00047A9ADA|nr:hypothetical protein [Sediminibacter sp. Hel_I_10]
MTVEYHGRNALVQTEDVAFTFESAENPRDFDKYRSAQETLDWTDQEYLIGNYRVFPYGTNNDLPKVIKDVVQNNSIAPGILKKKSQLIWGKGPQLYTEVIEDNALKRNWVQDKEIQDWLDSWEYLDYLNKAVVDFSNIEGVFTKFNMAKGMRVGRPSVASLEHSSPEDSRLATDLQLLNPKPKYCIVTDWTFKRVVSVTDYKVYALFDMRNPFQYRNAILYSNMYSFCSDYYTVPDIYGSLEWVRRSSAIPMILKALSKNSINLKYHVISPARFWEEKKGELEKKAEQNGEKYQDSDLIKYKTEYLRQVSKVLSGAENTGKFWHSIKYATVEGHKIFEEGWEIKEIKQNIKDFVASQISISDQANRMVAAGVGMHPALGGAGESGRSDSGSEQLYALKNYLLTGIDIPEQIIMKAINYALKLNFPGKDFKLGFYHMAPEKEEDVSEKKRIKNN